MSPSKTQPSHKASHVSPSPPPKRLLTAPRGPSRLVFRWSFPGEYTTRDPVEDVRRMRVCLEGVSALAARGYDEEDVPRFAFLDFGFKLRLKNVLQCVRDAGRALVASTIAWNRS